MQLDLHEAYLQLNEALGNPNLDTNGESDEIALVREATRRILQLPLIEWQRTRTIVTLPSARLTPQVVLARTLEKASYGKIQSVWIGVEWAADNTFTYDYSLMAVRDLAMHSVVLNRRLQMVAFPSASDDEAKGI